MVFVYLYIKGDNFASIYFIGLCLVAITFSSIEFGFLIRLMKNYHKFEYESNSTPSIRFFGNLMFTIVIQCLFFFFLMYGYWEGQAKFGSFNIAFMKMCNLHENSAKWVILLFMINF